MKLAKREYQPLKEGEYSIRKDEVFKIVFGSNERSEFLKAFLESILHKKITNIVIRNDVALDKLHADNKLMRLDILAEIDGKEKINVEMQNWNEYNIEERTNAYASRNLLQFVKGCTKIYLRKENNNNMDIRIQFVQRR